MASISSVQGIASGIQWQDMVDQLIALDQSRELDPITQQLTTNSTKAGAWSSYKSVAQTLADIAAQLRDGTAFGGALATGGTSASSGRALYTATASNGAQPGQYQVEVVSLAQSEKIAGNAVASTSAALGYSGSFTVNGQAFTVAATDSLASIRDAINAKTSTTQVTATILAAGNGTSRLVLTSNAAGARGIELVDSSATNGILQQLGFLDGTYSFETNDTGTSTSAFFKASDTAVGTMLGITPPSATSIRVGNVTISVDLANDSLADIATRLEAAGVNAEVTSATQGGVTSYHLDVGGNVSAIPDANNAANPDADSLRALEMLGYAHGGRSAIAQSVASGALAAADDSPATTSTLLSDLKAAGTSANMQAGDTITIAGRKGDGTAVSATFAIGAGSTLGDLVAAINDSSAFGGGTRTATASVGTDGSIKLTDNTSGNSQLALSLSVTKSVANGGGSTGIGAFNLSSAGRQREVVAGADAKIRVDGALYSRTSNTISDAISGVTLKLQQSEVGTSTTLSVSRDYNAAVSSVTAFAKAFNDLIAFVNKNTATGGMLEGNGSLRSSGRSLVQAMLTDVLGGSYTRATLVGVSLDKAGALQVDSSALTAALQKDETGVRRLFGLNGSVTGTSLEFIAASDSTVDGTYSVEVTSAATAPSVTSAGATLPFDDGGVARSMSITDGATSKSGSIALETGDTADDIADKLNAMFASKGLLLTATTQSGALVVTGTQYGSAANFTVAYGTGDTTSAGQVGVTAQKYSGTDIVGKIDGILATGKGQTLTANIGSNASGLVVRYSGTTAGVIGSAKVTVGTGALVTRLARGITRSGDGLADSMATALDVSTKSLLRKSDDVSARLERRRASLLHQFSSMESAIGRIQDQGNRIASLIKSLQSSNE